MIFKINHWIRIITSTGYVPSPCLYKADLISCKVILWQFQVSSGCQRENEKTLLSTKVFIHKNDSSSCVEADNPIISTRSCSQDWLILVIALHVNKNTHVLRLDISPISWANLTGQSLVQIMLQCWIALLKTATVPGMIKFYGELAHVTAASGQFDPEIYSWQPCGASSPALFGVFDSSVHLRLWVPLMS